MSIRSWFRCPICDRDRSVDQHGYIPYKDEGVCEECKEGGIEKLASRAAWHWKEIRSAVNPAHCDIGASLDPLVDFLDEVKKRG